MGSASCVSEVADNPVDATEHRGPTGGQGQTKRHLLFDREQVPFFVPSSLPGDLPLKLFVC